MRRAAAFTLIEMMAVVLIFALMAAFVIPNLSIVKRRALRFDAEQLAAQIELARQRAVVTSVPHRLLLDLEEGSYRLEWLGQPADAPQDPDGRPAYDLRGATPLPLAAPREEGLEFQPLPGEFGSLQRLAGDVLFAGVETPAGWVERGQVSVRFERDGSASYTLIVMSNEDGDALEIQVLPLADSVRVRDAEG